MIYKIKKIRSCTKTIRENDLEIKKWSETRTARTFSIDFMIEAVKFPIPIFKSNSSDSSYTYYTNLVEQSLHNCDNLDHKRE